MAKFSFSREVAAFFAAASIVFVCPVVHAEEILGPMAGAGGVMRDAERRAQAPVPTKEPTEILAIVPAAQLSAEEAAAARVLGPVAAVTAYGSTEFAAREHIADLLLERLGDGGDKTDADVAEALVAVRAELMKRGYYLCRITLARARAYDAETQTLGVLVDEGRFGEISVRFDGEDEEGRWFARRQILRRFRKIEEGTPFNYEKMREVLFDVNSHPDLTIDTSVNVRRPIEGEGDDRRIARYADLDFTVKEAFPLHMVWEINNYGMEEVEEWQTSLTLQYLNLTKHDDVLTFSPSMSFGSELKSFAGSYMLPHDYWRGGNTTLYGGYSSLDVDNVVRQLDLEGTGWFVGLQHSENIYDTDRHLWSISAGILWRYIEDQYSALGYKLNKREVSILPLSLALSYTGRKADFLGGRNFATVQGLVNVMTSGDSLDELWTDADKNYKILRWQLARLQPIFGWFNPRTEQNDLHQWMLFMKAEGQYSPDTLIPVEKLSMGGYNCMRGYRTRGYLGDWGFYGTTELRTPLLVDTFSSLFGDRTDKSPIDRLQFLGFVDYGWTCFNDLPSGYDDKEFIYSTGFGARVALTSHTQLKCDVAFPLRDTDWADDDNVEVYFSVQMQF